MQVRLDPAHDEDWTLAMTYAAWSINVDLFARPKESFAGEFHDCGHSISLKLSEDESRQLADQIGPNLIVTPCEPLTHESKAADT
jgi:hypothetical protein